jgi:hypothetical protein
MADLDTLRMLAEEATPGKWERDGDFVRDTVGLRIAECFANWKPDERIAADASYIAACDPQTILALLDENERLRAAIVAMRDRDDRNGSLPPWYREQIDAVLGPHP